MLATSELAGVALSVESALTSDPQAGQIQCSVRPRRTIYLRFKNFGEWLTALVLLILASPVMLVLAMLIKLTSHGPIIYAQTRLGRRVWADAEGLIEFSSSGLWCMMPSDTPGRYGRPRKMEGSLNWAGSFAILIWTSCLNCG